MKIILEHVRSFATRRSVELKPLTLLIGENSSGKSTFLSIVSAVMDASRFPANPGFNETPYNLGTFENIATFRGGKYGRDDTFSIGFSVSEDRRDYREVVASYFNSNGTAALNHLVLKGTYGEIDLTVSRDAIRGYLSISQSGPSTSRIEFESKRPDPKMTGQNVFNFQLMEAISRSPVAHNKDSITNDFPKIMRILDQLTPPFKESFSFAPIRSKPRRTYDELREELNPECDHIPSLLARLLRYEKDSAEAVRLVDALKKFGDESGLFRMINVKKLGSKMTDPFQIQVTGAGPPVNITDVGYGVSQSLPIIVQSILQSPSKAMLMQQPEVHLHPRGQAALGTFLSHLAEKGDRLLLVETHSDYLVDRVRQEVAKGTIPADFVQILFFHKPKLETSIHEITIDAQGNILGAPNYYRSFFLQEELNLFNRTNEE